jgi:hypothetical protein
MKKFLLLALPFFIIVNAKAQTFGYFASAVLLGDSVSQNFYSTAPTSGVNAISTTNNFNSFLGSFPENPRALIIKGGEVKTWFNYFNSEGSAVGVCSVTLYFTVYLQGQRPPNPSFTGISLGYFDSCDNGAFPTGGPCSLGDKKWQTTGGTYSLSDYAPGNYVVEVYYDIAGTSSVDGENPCGEHVYDNNNSNPTNYTATFTITPALVAPTITTVPAKATDLCPGTSVTLTSSAATGNLWSTGDTTQSIVTDTAGSYSVKVTANGVSATSAATQVSYRACGRPASTMASAISSTKATISWAKVHCAAEYTLEYRKAGVTAYKKLIVADTLRKLNNLLPSTTYQWRVRTVCVEAPSDASAYTVLNNFTTTAGFALDNMAAHSNDGINIAPDPAHSSITVSFAGDDANTILQVVNAAGQYIIQKQITAFAGSNTVQLDVSKLPAGIYMLLVKTKNGVQTKRFIKE